MDNEKEISLMDCIFSCLIENSLEKALPLDFDYQELTLELHGIDEVYRDLELSQVEKEVIDKYIEISNMCGALYGKCAYETGFKDCIKILKELEILQCDKYCN